MTVGGGCSVTAMLGGELTRNAMRACCEAASADALLMCAVRMACTPEAIAADVTPPGAFRWLGCAGTGSGQGFNVPQFFKSHHGREQGQHLQIC